MYYNEKEHPRNKKYTEESIIWNGSEHKTNEDYEKEVFLLKNEDYKQIYDIMEYKIQYISPELKNVKCYQEDEYIAKEYGEIELYKWLQQIDTISAAIIAEIIHAPKLTLAIENKRPDVKHMKTISIDEYKKIKCIGYTKAKHLKQLKTKYGIHLLRLLYRITNIKTVVSQ
jgi:hypothetical protein